MNRIIGIEDVIANSLIALLEKCDSKNYISLELLVEYGTSVVRYLQDSGEEVVLLVSKRYMDEAIRNYSDFFEIKFQDGKECIFLRDDKTSEDLRDRFRSYLSLEVLKAFVAQKNLDILVA